ncbi:hypothetical protein DD559_00530 [Sphingomonas pokkalii]|uniref:Uncharacterized protein n=1 Tax=Sphingomonas pokkalii TaxID=2175090 RepID=A0A2U0S9L2_9SPHN|nr:hypothetical protein DD559_00530 [Sphingomonas pokkalii]
MALVPRFLLPAHRRMDSRLRGNDRVLSGEPRPQNSFAIAWLWAGEETRGQPSERRRDDFPSHTG